MFQGIKLKAFTVLELLVVMMITSILVVIIGNVILNLTQYRQIIERRTEEVDNIEQLNFLISQDESMARSIHWTEDSLVFRSARREVAYFQNDFVVIRKQIATYDTFPFSMSATEVIMENGLLKFCKLNFADTLNNQFDVVLSKEYSAVQLFNEPE